MVSRWNVIEPHPPASTAPSSAFPICLNFPRGGVGASIVPPLGLNSPKAPVRQEMPAMSPVWGGHWQSVSTILIPSQVLRSLCHRRPIPGQELSQLGTGERTGPGERTGRGEDGRDTRRDELCGPEQWLLKADLLWLSCRKQMLISSEGGLPSLPP